MKDDASNRAAPGAARRIGRDVGALLLGRLVGAALGVTALALLTRGLGVAGFGGYTYVVALFNVFVIVVGFGGNAIATADIARTPDRTADVLGALLGARMMTATAGALMLAGIAIALEGPSTRTPLLLAAPFLLAAGLGAMESLFHAKQRMVVPVTSRLASQAVFVAAIAMLEARDGLTLTSAVLAFGIAALLDRGLTFVRGVRLVRPRRPRDFAPIRDLLRRSAPYGLATLFGLLYFHVDTLMLKPIRGDVETGYYGAAYRLFSFLVVVPALLATPMLPELARDRTAFARIYARTFQQALVLGLSAVAAIAVLAGDIVAGLYGLEDYAPSIPLLRLLGFAFAAVCIGTLGGTALVALGRQTSWAKITGSCLALNLALNAWLIPEHGAQGAAIATVATELLAAIAAVWVIRRREGWLPFSRPQPDLVWLPLTVLGVSFALRPLGIVPAAVGIAGLGAAYFVLRTRSILEESDAADQSAGR